MNKTMIDNLQNYLMEEGLEMSKDYQQELREYLDLPEETEVKS